jgi:hypothetical protein
LASIMSNDSVEMRSAEWTAASPLPSWLPDETLFSLASRYHRLAGHQTSATTTLALFGHRRRGCQHDLPNRLGELARRTEGRLGTSEQLAIDRVLLPLYLPHRDREQAAGVVSLMTGHASGMLKFRGEPFDAVSIMKWRQQMLAAGDYRRVKP